MNRKTYLTILLSFIFSVVATAEMNVPIQLRLKSPGGAYPTESGLSFKLVILTPASGCILREEDFSSQAITNGNVSLSLGSGVRGVSDPSLTLNQVYDNSKTKTGLTCVDANNSIVSSGQSYVPAASDGRIIRVLTTIGGDPVLANFNMRATPYAIQAESVGGKSAADLIVKDVSSQMNQTNLNDLLQDVTRFNNLKSIALSGQAASATTATTAANFSGALAGDVSGTQSATSVNKIKGVAVSATAPVAGQVLQYDGVQYVPSNLASGSVVSVAGKSGIVTLVSSDISGFGDAAGMSIGSTAGTVAAGNDSRLVSAYSDTLNATAANTASTLVKRDASGNVATTNLLSSNNSTNNLYLYDGVNSVRLKAPAGLAANYVLTLPPDDGTPGQSLRTDGAGNLAWVTSTGGGGTVMDVTASAPLASSGGTNPNLTITQASAASAGFLSSTDWTTFNSKQNALGFTPLDSAFFNASVASSSCTSTQSLYWNSVSSQFLCQGISFPADAVTSVAGRTGVIALVSSDISGLGGAAALNVGTVAGTVAAGNDSRIVNAVQTSSAFSGDVTGTQTAISVVKIQGEPVSAAPPTSGDVLRYNGTQYIPTALPADAVSSVAGKVGTVSLVSADISGLGAAAGLNVGTAAGTVAAGNDSRMVNAVQTSSAFSGDVTGTLSAVSVNKLRGINISVTAPANGDVLQFNGTQYVPIAIPSAPVSMVAGRTGAIVLSSSDISGLGNSAGLNVGTSAGSVAAGDDSRIVNAVQTSSTFSGDVTGTLSALSVNKIRGVAVSASVPANGDVLQYNGAQYVPVAIPSAPVSTVAGRTGAVVLSSSDISGLGTAAVLNAGVAAANLVQLDGSAKIPLSTLPTSVITTSTFASATATGALSSADWSTFNSKQNALGYTPLNPANNLSDLGLVATARTNLGLGSAAVLNVGTAASTVAAGDDSRITGALQSSVFNGYVTSASCTTSQSLYWNSVSSQFLCQGIVFPADAVTSVAGRIGAVVLSSSDISGLGNSAGLNVGTAASTVAAGNDSRIVNALQPSTALSGDVTGTSSSVSVNKIRGVTVSATAPANGDVLQYNGTQYVPIAIPSAPVSSVAGRTGAVVLSNTDISGLGTAAVLNAGVAATNLVQLDGSAKIPLSTLPTSVITTSTLASATATGALSSADWSTFNSKQNALGFTPLNPANNLSDLGSVITARTNLGLGGAAILNIGTAASTVAAGNDSRIIGALQSSVFNGYVTSASCTSIQSMYWNSVSSQFSCQSIAFPADAVSSVAGRTGAVVLSSSDISGLGTAAGFNVGVAANNIVQLDGTARIPASTLPTIALTTSSVYSGDVSGTSTTMSVDRLKGVAVSAAAPTAGQALVYNGTQWIPTTGFPSFARKTVDETFAVLALANVTSLSFNVVAGVTYKYKFNIMYTSAATATGLRLGLTYPAVTSASGIVNIASGNDGTGAYYQGVINATGDSVQALNTPAATPLVMLANVEGIIVPSAAGAVQLQAATEIAASNIVILAGSFVEVVVIP